MKDSVSAVFTCGEKIFIVQRQGYLQAFPGYHAFPGGKIDATDPEATVEGDFFSNYPGKNMAALIREMQEELGVDLRELAKTGELVSFCELGYAETPDFNPHRFKNHFYKAELKSEYNFDVDESECQASAWMPAADVVKLYEDGKILVVPPVLKVFKAMAEDPTRSEISKINFEYDGANEVPAIESINGLRQLMPLSNTLPPAKRTNCFLIGDEGSDKILVDPSPKDEEELRKLLITADKVGFESIFITHHHPDHWEFAPKIARDRDLVMMMSEKCYDRINTQRGMEVLEGVKIEFVKDGDIVAKSLGEDVIVHEVPGHADSQLALATKSLGWFIVGDLIQGVGSVVIGTESGNMADYFASLEKVIDLNPRFIMPSHGIASGGTNRITRVLEHRKLREKQILKLYEEGNDKDGILNAIYSGLDKRLRPYAMANIESHMIKLGIH